MSLSDMDFKMNEIIEYFLKNPDDLSKGTIEDLIDKDLIKLEASDKFYQALKKKSKEFLPKKGFFSLNNSDKPYFVKCFEYLQERIIVKIQDKYLDFLIEEIQEMKGKNSWAGNITKVMAETAGYYELEMEEEIRKVYQD